MSEIMTQLGNFLNSGAGKGLLTAGTAGTGLIQNFMANQQAQKKQKFVQDLITNPAKFNAFVSGFEKPLTQGLTADVARQTDAYGAERGLGSSPTVMKDVYAQALAPLIAGQQQSAQQAALQSLGIYENSPTQKPVDISSMLKMLMSSQNSGPTPNLTPSSGGGGGGITDLSNTQLPPPLVGGGFDPTTMEGNM